MNLKCGKVYKVAFGYNMGKTQELEVRATN
jgi:hypothetical protein